MPTQPVTHTRLHLPGMTPSLKRPVRMVARDLNAAELLVAHSHAWGQVTYALAGVVRVSVGNSAWIGDECVLHGPLRVGHNLVCEDGAVLFRAHVEDNVTLRSGCTVIGDVLLREGTIVPEGAVIETQAQADALPAR